jgi:hypothetical protein
MDGLYDAAKALSVNEVVNHPFMESVASDGSSEDLTSLQRVYASYGLNPGPMTRPAQKDCKIGLVQDGSTLQAHAMSVARL